LAYDMTVGASQSDNWVRHSLTEFPRGKLLSQKSIREKREKILE
jgi:hypothetical protein